MEALPLHRFLIGTQMNRLFTLATSLTVTVASMAGPTANHENGSAERQDSTRVIDIEEVLVVASPKEHTKLRQQALSVSLLSKQAMDNHQVNSLKDITSLVPNFYMPDYGSRLTSAVYIRGVGSRMNTPAVGLYVDNIPYLDKSTFDFNFYDIERIDVLRGPQGTLYGRNTMGGLIKAYTKSPFRYQGTDIQLSAANANGSLGASVTHYHRISNRFAFSAGGFYRHADGYFRNAYLNKRADAQESAGGRLRAIWFPTENLKADFSVGYEYSDEGGYAYGAYDKDTGTLSPTSTDSEGSYRRGLFHTGLELEYQMSGLTLSSITGYQNLNDRMFMDQDFTSASIYTLEQQQHLNAYTEELTLKNRTLGNWKWVTGLFLSYQDLNTQSPVTFRQDGMQMLSGIINRNLPNETLSPLGMSMAVKLNSETMPVQADFCTPAFSVAMFHQSTFDNLLTEGLSFTVGLRVEHERLAMDYSTLTELPYDFTFSSARMPINLTGQNAVSRLKGKAKNHYTELLPKFTLKYDLTSSDNIYLSASRGFRSGGYNLQMFSDVAQSDLSNRMMQQIKEGCNQQLDTYAGMGMPDRVLSMVRGYLDYIPVSEEELDINQATSYKPEYSWNYEIGSHVTLCDGKVQADAALFAMDTRNQQIAKFVDSGLGRIMVNAGRSRSYGAEASLQASLSKQLQLNASYGYTRAVFKEYDEGDAESDYHGNYVPFVPRQTLNVGATYTFFFQPDRPLKQLLFHVNYTGTGKTYWTEANDASQAYYGFYNGRVSLQTKRMQIDLWGHNLFNRSYHTFYFESRGTGFAQPSKPRQVGIDIKFNI